VTKQVLYLREYLLTFVKTFVIGVYYVSQFKPSLYEEINMVGRNIYTLCFNTWEIIWQFNYQVMEKDVEVKLKPLSMILHRWINGAVDCESVYFINLSILFFCWLQTEIMLYWEALSNL